MTTDWMAQIQDFNDKAVDTSTKEIEKTNGFAVDSTQAQKISVQDFIKSGEYLIDEVKKRACTGSPHFFDTTTMRYFSSRVSELAWKKGDDIFFITSEKDTGHIKHKGSTRAFTVRKCDKAGDIKTVGYGFQKEPTLAQARRTIKDIFEGKIQEDMKN